MDVSVDVLAAVVGRRLDEAAVVAFFLTQPATAARRREGRLDLAGVRSLSSKQLGYDVAHRKGRVTTVFLYLEARDGFAPFRGPLTAGLAATDGRADVRRKLGPATRSGAADPAGLWPWDRFDTPTVCLHVGYGEAGFGLRMLTLMAPDTAP